jgi:hypothetical protein
MPWRRDFAEACWIDPDYRGLSGYRPGSAEHGKVKSIADPAPPELKDVEQAVLIMRDRIGFQYERLVGLDDFVSQRDVAALLSVDVMTVTRWVKAKKLPSRKRKGFVVVRLRDVVAAARRQEIPLPLHFLLIVQKEDHQERNWYPTGGSR